MNKVLALAVAALAAVALSACGGAATPAKPPPHATRVPNPKATQPPPVIAGAGTVSFGTGRSGSHLTGAASSFKTPKKLIWIADFGSSPSTKPVTLQVTRINGPGTFPRLVWTAKVVMPAVRRVVSGQMMASQLKTRKITSGGKFTMTYRQGAQKLATGTFQLASTAGGGHVGY